MFQATTIEETSGFAPAVLYRASDGTWSEFVLIGLWSTAEEALAIALEAVEAIRADMRSATPEGFDW